MFEINNKNIISQKALSFLYLFIYFKRIYHLKIPFCRFSWIRENKKNRSEWGYYEGRNKYKYGFISARKCYFLINERKKKITHSI